MKIQKTFRNSLVKLRKILCQWHAVNHLSLPTSMTFLHIYSGAHRAPLVQLWRIDIKSFPYWLLDTFLLLTFLKWTGQYGERANPFGFSTSCAGILKSLRKVLSELSHAVNGICLLTNNMKLKVCSTFVNPFFWKLIIHSWLLFQPQQPLSDPIKLYRFHWFFYFLYFLIFSMFNHNNSVLSLKCFKVFYFLSFFIHYAYVFLFCECFFPLESWLEVY